MNIVGELDNTVEKSSARNKEWFYKFREYATKEISGYQNYLSTIRQIYAHFNQEDINDISFEEISTYVSNFTNLRTKTNKVNHLKGFFQYLMNELNVSFTFDIPTLQQLAATQEELRNDDRRTAIPFTFKEIIALRKLLIEKERFALLFTFEMVYQYGLQLQELTEVYQKNYDTNTRTLQIGKNRSIQLNDNLHSYIIKYDLIPMRKYRTSAFSYRLSEISEIAKSFRSVEVLHKDIYQTHKHHFLPCPSCQTPTENNPSLWVILEFEEDNSQWLVCKECARSGNE